MDIILIKGRTPLYEQIMAQVKQQIAQGTLAPGEPIPSMRAPARTLHISVITVQKAYETLQQEGFIETVQGKGTFVSKASGDFLREEQLRGVEAHLEARPQPHTGMISRRRSSSSFSICFTRRINPSDDTQRS